MKTQYVPPSNEIEAIRECSKVIQKVVSKFTRNHYQDREDIQQMAYIGVLEAWKRYKPNYKNKFSTYAYFWVFAFVKDNVVRGWERMNSETSFNVDYHDTITTIDEKNIDLERQVDKKSEDFQIIYKMRDAGFTFKEIAEVLGYETLHKARNVYMSEVGSLEL